MHSKSMPPALQEAEDFTRGLHLSQGFNRPPAPTRPAPGPTSNGVSMAASDNLSLPIPFPPMSAFSYIPTTRPPSSLEQIRSSTKSFSKPLYTEASLSHDSPFGAFQDARKGSSASASALAAVIGRNQANANRSMQIADGAFQRARPPSFGNGSSFAGDNSNSTARSGYPTTLPDDDFLAGSSRLR